HRDDPLRPRRRTGRAVGAPALRRRARNRARPGRSSGRGDGRGGVIAARPPARSRLDPVTGFEAEVAAGQLAPADDSPKVRPGNDRREIDLTYSGRSPGELGKPRYPGKSPHHVRRISQQSPTRPTCGRSTTRPRPTPGRSTTRPRPTPGRSTTRPRPTPGRSTSPTRA